MLVCRLKFGTKVPNGPPAVSSVRHRGGRGHTVSNHTNGGSLTPAHIYPRDTAGEPLQSSGGTRRVQLSAFTPGEASPKVGDYSGDSAGRSRVPASMRGRFRTRGQLVPSPTPSG